MFKTSLKEMRLESPVTKEEADEVTVAFHCIFMIITISIIFNVISIIIRGAVKFVFRKNLGIWPSQRAPPPPRKLGRQKKKNKFNVYFAF